MIGAKLERPCERCQQRERVEATGGLCQPCFDLPADDGGFNRAWWKDRGPAFTSELEARREAHRIPLTSARHFGEVFTDFEIRVALGVDTYERNGHAPIEMPYGTVSRYCSVHHTGRDYALIVLPTRDLLLRIGEDELLMRDWTKHHGLTWSIETVGGGIAKVCHVNRGLNGWGSSRLVALINAGTVPRKGESR